MLHCALASSCCTSSAGMTNLLPAALVARSMRWAGGTPLLRGSAGAGSDALVTILLV